MKDASQGRGVSDSLLVANLAESDIVVRHMSVPARWVVFIKGVLEASEGIGAMFADQGGELTIVSPASRMQELDALLQDLEAEVHATRG